MSQELEQETAKKKIQTVIFDLDGTLLNTIEDLTDSVNAVCTQYGYPVYPVETIKSYVGNGIRKLIERAIPQGAENPQYEGVYESFCAYYQKHCRVKTRPYDGILTMLDTLKAQGIAVGIVSNKNHNAVVELRDTFFKDAIPAAIGQSDTTRKKPAPEWISRPQIMRGCRVFWSAGVSGNVQHWKSWEHGELQILLSRFLKK